MDNTIKKWWLELSEASLRNNLTARKLPPVLVGQLVAEVQEMKAQRRKERIKSTVTAKSWKPLLDSARAERQTVFVMKAQLKKQVPTNQCKWDALCAYETVITTVVEKLTRVQRGSVHTPKSFIAFLKEETGRVIPNEGTHWSDYVKASDRQRIALLFDALPPPIRGKRKTPFGRHITKAAHKEQRLTLVKRLNGEIASAEREYEVTTDPEAQDKLNRQLDAMHRAQYELDRLPPTAPLPATWHGLLK